MIYWKNAIFINNQECIIMKLVLRNVFCLILLSLISVTIYGAHILGGHMSYEVLSLQNNFFEVKVDVEMYREVDFGANFDQQIRLGLFRKNGPNDYSYVQTLFTQLDGFVEVEADVSPDCGTSFNATERGFYSDELLIPNDGEDYIIAFLRCCRTNTIVNISSPQETGIALHMIITSAGLQNNNKSHKLTNPMDRFLEIGVSNNIDITLDENTDQYVTEFVVPFTVGGTDGSGTNEGDLNSCTGVTPDPLICPPPYDQVLINPLISENSLFYDNDPFEKLSEFEYSIIPNLSGAYLISYYIHEYRNSILLSSHYVEQVYVVTNCEITLDNEQTQLVTAPKLYPNPVMDVIHLESRSDIKYHSAQVLDINGIEIMSIGMDDINEIEVAGLSSGLYFLKVNSNADIDLLKFIKY